MDAERLPVTADDVAVARDLSVRYPELPAPDLVHVAVMINNDIRVIITADRHFDSVTEVERLDPNELINAGS